LITSTVNYQWKEKVILIVEDDSPNYLYFKSLLKKTKAHIVWKKNGTEAFDYIKDTANPIDLIIMDVLIPFMNGIEVTRESKKLRKNLPVIVVTAYTSREIKEKCFIAGCDEFIIKPVLPNQLIELLAEYFHDKMDISTYQLS
jgi:CheY-like chemotaxis protein